MHKTKLKYESPVTTMEEIRGEGELMFGSVPTILISGKENLEQIKQVVEEDEDAWDKPSSARNSTFGFSWDD